MPELCLAHPICAVRQRQELPVFRGEKWSFPHKSHMKGPRPWHSSRQPQVQIPRSRLLVVYPKDLVCSGIVFYDLRLHTS